MGLGPAEWGSSSLWRPRPTATQPGLLIILYILNLSLCAPSLPPPKPHHAERLAALEGLEEVILPPSRTPLPSAADEEGPAWHTLGPAARAQRLKQALGPAWAAAAAGKGEAETGGRDGVAGAVSDEGRGRNEASSSSPCSPMSSSSSSPPLLRCRNVAMGGTFDRLHSGHMLLLATAGLVATEKLYVGITGVGRGSGRLGWSGGALSIRVLMPPLFNAMRELPSVSPSMHTSDCLPYMQLMHPFTIP